MWTTVSRADWSTLLAMYNSRGRNRGLKEGVGQPNTCMGDAEDKVPERKLRVTWLDGWPIRKIKGKRRAAGRFKSFR
mgnify:CR=1 FL=1